MRDAIGRQPASFLDDGLTATPHQRILRPLCRCDWETCAHRATPPMNKETSHVAIDSRR
jgi:hypothetical protein